MEADPINDWELTTGSNAFNIVIVGKTGNGKSATGNSILGKKDFFSKHSLSGVTNTSELKRSILKDGRIVNVIDTPGLFDFSDSELIGSEIVKCIDFAKDGIHAVLMVFSIRSRFSREEEASFQTMKSLFGDKIVNYMIVVFTGGDTLESDGQSLKEFLNPYPEPLRKIIQSCSNRVILFDNTTKDKIKREGQVNELLLLVQSVIEENGGKPYSDKMFAELKEGALLRDQKVKEAEAKGGCSKEELSELMKENSKSYNDQLKCLTEMVEEKLKLTVDMLQKQLAEEQAARLEAIRFAEVSQKKFEMLLTESRNISEKEIEKLKESRNISEGEIEKLKESRNMSEKEIQKLNEELKNARMLSEALNRQISQQRSCAIM